MKKEKMLMAAALLLVSVHVTAAQAPYYWVDPVTNVVRTSVWKPVGITTYATRLEADGNLVRYWVNSGNQVVQGVKKDVPAGQMVYIKRAGAEEFAAMGGHSVINLSPVLARGHRGAGVTVAVVDTGIDSAHSELSGKVTTSKSWDYVTNAKPVNGAAADPNGHGSHVAGIIAGSLNNLGFHGVAPSAKLLNLRTLGASGGGSFSDSILIGPVNQGMTAGARIFNNSWGVGTRADAGAGLLSEPVMSRYKSAVAGDAVFVFANGNSGLAQPQYMAGLPLYSQELQKGWVAVAALDPSTGLIAGYSDRCGVAASWCITAPGSSILSVQRGGGSTYKSGTSMATPYVSGSIALLKSQFKTLKHQDVVQRLFYTANKSGAYADKSTYGNGVMNVGAASNPIGGLWVPLSGTIYGKAANLSSLVVSANADSAAAAALLTQLKTVNLLVVDGYQRAPFTARASDLLVVTQKTGDPLNWGSQNIRFSETVTTIPQSGFTMSMADSGFAFASPSMSMGLVSGDSKFSLTSSMTLSSLDQSSLRQGAAGFSEFFRGANPLEQGVVSGASYQTELMPGLRMTASTFSGEREPMNMRLGLERGFGATSVGLEASMARGASPSMGFDFGQGQPDASSSYQMAYAKHAVTENFSVMGAIAAKRLSDDRSFGGLSVAQSDTRNELMLGASLSVGEASNLGLAVRRELSSRSSYSMRLPVDVSESGDVMYRNFDVSASRPGLNSVGVFWDAKTRNHQAVASLVRSGVDTKAHVGYKMSY
jgi:subtilisin family serine protease